MFRISSTYNLDIIRKNRSPLTRQSPISNPITAATMVPQNARRQGHHQALDQQVRHPGSGFGVGRDDEIEHRPPIPVVDKNVVDAIDDEGEEQDHQRDDPHVHLLNSPPALGRRWRAIHRHIDDSLEVTPDSPACRG